MVVFAGIEFIFRFLPIFLFIYYIVPGKYKDLIALAGSLVFYASGEPVLIFLLIGMTVLNHFLGRYIWDKNQDEYLSEQVEKSRRMSFLAAVILDVLVLMGFKIWQMLDGSRSLPMGLSFYVFKMIAFQIDLYREKIRRQPGLYRTALYFTLFSQVTSGPIMRYGEGGFDEADQEKKGSFPGGLEEGLRYFIAGLGMKVILADRLAILWRDIQTIGFLSISTPLAWLGAAAYSLQLYFDFWGYSLMAGGIGVMMGYQFILNFNHPYSARSVSEFYRRWHVTLGSWFRDYVYIPMGGSRGSVKRLIFNLLVVWLLTGLWHGNGPNYLIWGLALGITIVIEKLWLSKYLEKISWGGVVYTVFVIMLTWMIFAIGDLKELGVYFARLFPVFGREHYSVNKGDILNYLQTYWKLITAGIILCVPGVFGLFERHKKRWYVTAGLVVVFWVSIYYLINAGSNPFLYFKY